MTENYENTSENQEESTTVVNDISFFMPGKVEKADEIKAPISKRYKDNQGNIIPFVFKPITTERVDELEKQSMKMVKQKGRHIGQELDQARFMARIAVESTIFPDFKSKELRQAYKTEDPIEVAKKVLNIAGEFSGWLSKASEVNGFDETPDDLEELAKNS
ncbi:Phage XkdN-like tail assembly chaperone protein, TAC [Gracilibacillus orientalis]|uniref:Phage XkdN-like tail assembly chaperone protein, TAC n=1 Tax=Gracilibacillus orientalis TaxID=334253 RepID=A0A1I4PNW1_9BACI|nr:phage portal protein [Gracilibacillus orientalis]SFM29180.1 Phage XkdN-like tail assembly chaperone protein, TAC [Gracilibacillus orientalis]